ncbi:hypothetical protein [Amycolatopsis sp. NPDC003676]
MPTTEREPYLDFLRAVSLVVVVLWHWAFTIPHWTPTGPQPTNLLAYFRGLWVLTWFLPVFFYVGLLSLLALMAWLYERFDVLVLVWLGGIALLVADVCHRRAAGLPDRPARDAAPGRRARTGETTLAARDGGLHQVLAAVVSLPHQRNGSSPRGRVLRF